MTAHDRAIAFDFDGTLVRSGMEKGVHILYAGYVACDRTAFRRFLHPADPAPDIRRLLAALLRYPGAPRFEQLSAMVNSLVHGRAEAAGPDALGLEPALAAEYPALTREYDRFYSALNEAAAASYWKAYPEAGPALGELGRRFDLYIASGVVQEILERDMALHGFAADRFVAAWGSDARGTRDKGAMLAAIRARGYRDTLFVGDANRDLEYARAAGVKFFRIREGSDFERLIRLARAELPDEPDPWAWTEEETRFFLDSALELAVRYRSGLSPTPADVAARLAAARDLV